MLYRNRMPLEEDVSNSSISLFALKRKSGEKKEHNLVIAFGVTKQISIAKFAPSSSAGWLKCLCWLADYSKDHGV